MRHEDQQRILQAVHDHVVRSVLPPHGQRPLEEVLAHGVYAAQQDAGRRADRQASMWQRPRRARQTFWDDLQLRLGRAQPVEQQSLLSMVIHRYAHAVCGNFDERVYNLARQALPPLLGALLNASSPKRLVTNWLDLAPLDGAVILQGQTEHVRRLHEAGTVILAPTHASNLDSVILAFATIQMGLPPFVYGAARDLFDNPLLGYFLHNLGAYTVDRRNHDPLYKQVLKEYATLTLEYGYNNLFFPGGARSRSGAMERRLKLGLAGTAIAAYVRNLQRQAARPKLFVVPATLSYQLVLEAETLVDDFLREAGKSRYIITDDEFSRPTRVYDFITQLFALDSKIYVTLGTGLDPFGNQVDDNGESLDPRGRHIDCSRYVTDKGVPKSDAARDTEYTHDLADGLVAAYARDNVIQATHITARAIFTVLRKQQGQSDILRLIRVGGTFDEGLPLRAVYQATKIILKVLKELSEKASLRLAAPIVHSSAEDVVSDGLRHFAIYHRAPAALRRGDRIIARERSLLFFYQNRLEGYGLEREHELSPTLSGDHCRLWGAEPAELGVR